MESVCDSYSIEGHSGKGFTIDAALKTNGITGKDFCILRSIEESRREIFRDD